MELNIDASCRWVYANSKVFGIRENKVLIAALAVISVSVNLGKLLN